MFGLEVVPTLFFLAVILTVPESPRWLFAHARPKDAESVLRSYADENGVQQFLADIQEGLKTPMEQSWRALWTPAVRGSLFIAVGMTVLQQVTGINTIIYYGPQIFELAGIASHTSSILATLLVALVNVRSVEIVSGRNPWSNAFSIIGKLKWFRRPNFRDRIRSKPLRWRVRQDANNGVRHSIERDAASDYVWIAAQSLLPKAFCDHRDIRALLFISPKIPTQYWPDAEHIEIVRSYSPPKNLNRIADSSQCEEKSVLGGETVKKRLSFTVMLIARRGDRDIDKIARLVASEQVDDTRRLLKRQAAQK
jgi:hypothetical protein